MIAYIVRRLFSTFVVMAVVAFVVFSLLYLTPGDPAAVIAGDIATDEDIRNIHAQLRLDDPFLVQFGRWVWALLHGDLGTSIFTNLPVTTLIGQRVEPTVALTLCTLVVAIAVAVPLGVIAAAKAGTWLDRAVMAFSVLGFSVPVFVVAYGLILTFSVELDWLPVQGYRNSSRRRVGMAAPFDPAEHRARDRLRRADRAHDARQHARCAGAGLHPHGGGEGARTGSGADRSRAEERRDSGDDHHRHGHRAADQRRHRDRNRVCAARASGG